jgi:hypothetical protein
MRTAVRNVVLPHQQGWVGIEAQQLSVSFLICNHVSRKNPISAIQQ